MSWDTELAEILKTSRDIEHEKIIHLKARTTVYSHDSDLQWFSELLERQSGACAIEPTSTPAVTGKLGSMPATVKESITLDDSDGRSRALMRVPAPRLTGIKVRMQAKTLEVNVVEEAPVKVAEEAGPSTPQETVKQAPKPRRSVKKPPEATRSVSPAREEKPVEPAKKQKPVEVDARLVPPPKPLKVIRRRRAEEPKVFETAPKSFPRAMLAGVKVTPEEAG